MGGTPPPPPILWVFLKISMKTDAPPPPMEHPPLKNEAPQTEKQSPTLKSETSSRKWFLGKNLEKSETVIDTCVSIIKQHWKKMVEIPQEHDFLTWSIQNFVRKGKQFVRKYYITWLIDLTNKSWCRRILGFILCQVLLKIVLFC